MELRTYLRILLQKWWLIVPIFLLTLGLTAILTARQQPVYEARATYVVKLNTFLIDDNNFVSALDILSRRTEISTTYAEIAKSRHIKALAADSLNLSPLSRQNLSVDGRLIPGTNLLEITVQATDRAMAVEFIRAIGAETQAYVDNLYEVYELEELDPPTTRGAPVRPRVVLNLAVGAVAGLILGLGMAFLATYLQEPVLEPANPELRTLQRAAARKLIGEDERRELFSLQRQLSISREQLHHVELMLYGIHAVSVETHTAINRFLEHPVESANHPVPGADRRAASTEVDGSDATAVSDGNEGREAAAGTLDEMQSRSLPLTTPNGTESSQESAAAVDGATGGDETSWSGDGTESGIKLMATASREVRSEEEAPTVRRRKATRR